MAENTSFITLEESLARHLYLDWRRRVASEITTRAIKQVRAGQFDAAKRTVKELTFAPTIEANRGFIDQTALKAYLLGQSFFTEGRVADTMLARGAEPVPVVIGMTAGIMLTGLEQSVEAVRLAALKVIEEEEEIQSEELVFKAVIEGMASKLNTAVASGGAAIDVSANLTTSRLANYGALTEADGAGAGRYQISEVLDRRTCAVCRRMHGKTFSVAPALAQTEQILLTDNPQELASSQPFPSTSRQGISDMSGMSTDELVGAGWNKPPFHPSCRGIIVPVGDVGIGSMIAFAPLAEGLTATEAAAAEIASASS